jgi:predicted nucleic acid-binding protein
MNGLIPIGIVGILLRAKQKGLISEIKPYLDKLMNNKRRISQQLYDHVIFLASEDR